MILPPPPKLDTLLYWINTPPLDSTIHSSEKRKLLEESLPAQQLHALENQCQPYLKKLEATKNSLRASKQAPYPNKDEIQQKRAQIQADAWHYKFCIAGTLCPNQCQIYSSCWKFADKALGNEYMRRLAQNQALDTICRPEREMIERCIGRTVASNVDATFQLEPMGSSSVDLENSTII